MTVVAGCSGSFEDRWTLLIPEDAIALYLPAEGETSQMVPQSESAGLFRQPVSGTNYAPNAPYLGVVLMADVATGISPVWIFSTDSESLLKGTLQEGDFSLPVETIQLRQNHYQFNGIRIHILGGATDQNNLYIATIGDILVLSASPRSVEKFVMRSGQSHSDQSMGFGFYSPETLRPGDVILNPDMMDDWASTFSNVLFHPTLSNAFDGVDPVLLRETPKATTATSKASRASGSSNGSGWTMSGKVHFSDSVTGHLTQRLTGRAEELKLDRYITNNAAAYSILRIPSNVNEALVDSIFSELAIVTRKPSLLDDLRNAPSSEIAFVGLAESGFQAGSEVIYLRSLQNPSALRRVLNEMVAMGQAAIEGRLYVVDEPEIARYLTGADFAPGERFYLDLFEDAVVVSTRAGLTESVRDDASRRNVLRFHPDYLTQMDSYGRRVSFIASLRSERFFPFITPWLQTGRTTEGFEALEFLRRSGKYTLIGTREELTDPVQVLLSATSTAEEIQPYRELWVYPLPDVELSGIPIFANMGGSERPEIIFSTVNGSVVVLAADGTSILQLSTGADTPLGSPVAYDWYGTRQNVLLQAAGSSIYGWDQNGNRLPGFPIRLQERIVSPLVVADITRNGLPELLLSTADRKVHVLQARGVPVTGWPQTMNSTITGAPLLYSHNGSTSIFAVSQNTLHGWTGKGELLPGYPYFEMEPFSSEPVSMPDGQLLLATQGGSVLLLDAFSMEGMSARAGADTRQEDSGGTGRPLAGQRNRLLISQSGILGKPRFVPNQQIRIPAIQTLTPEVIASLSASERDSLESAQMTLREDLVFAASPEGSLYLYNLDGGLRFIQNMGQEISEFSPISIQDLNRDQLPELVSTGRFGRLFAWTIATSERMLDLPANGMQYPVFTDLDLDQRIELIALTREGLRCWTLQ